MKVAIISDTHDNSPAVVSIITQLNQKQILVAFHAGDIVNPGMVRRFREHYEGTLHFVFGNNDGELSGLTRLAGESDNLVCHNREMDLSLEGKRIFMNHYTYVAKAVAQTGEYDVAIGGHTHEYEVSIIGKTLFINPGNTVTKDPWLLWPEWERVSSYVILDLATLEYEQIVLETYDQN